MFFWALPHFIRATTAMVFVAFTATATATQPARETRLVCTVAYQPSGHAWVREVVLVDSGKALQAVRIDGVPVYAFMRQGPVIRTALDNERIEIDLARPGWASDFRGLALGVGHCVVQP